MDHADVLILGGGLVGATLAIALDRHGLKTIVVDPADPTVTTAIGFDGRASAIASASHRMLEAIGVAGGFEGHGCAIRHIRVSDGLAPGKLDFIPDADDGALGTMYENRRLRIALGEALKRSTVDLRMKTRATAVTRGPAGVTATLSSGETVGASLLVAAEGRNSPTRADAGIKVAQWRYDHAAIISAFHHERPHEEIAYEIFYAAGPFALLPLVDDEIGHRSAIVWTVKAADAPAMLKLGDRAFLAEAEKRMGGFLGALSGASPRASFPLGFHHAATITGERLALVGDAAHVIHPIAGQGLNLGLKDIAALAEVIVDAVRLGLDPGQADVLERYQRWRRFDTMAMGIATNGLNVLFSNRSSVLRTVRDIGLGLVDRMPPLKNALIKQAAGLSGEVPRLLRGEAL